MTKGVEAVAVKLNKKALDQATRMIKANDVTRDERDDWSEHAPSTEKENQFIKSKDWNAYALWHLGVDEAKSEETKGRYSFPYGDFSRVHRCAVISLESRAAQNDHDDIAKAAKDLLERIDAD
jgi:hypothetical protein